MSLYSDWVNANCDPDDIDEPENRCEQCGSFIRKAPLVTKTECKLTPGIMAEHLDITCKRCGRTYFYESYALTPWGTIDFDYLRDSNGDWIYDLAEIEKIVRAKLNRVHSEPLF